MRCGDFELLTDDGSAFRRRVELISRLNAPHEPHRRWSADSVPVFLWVGVRGDSAAEQRFLTSFFLCLYRFSRLLSGDMYGIDGAKSGTIPSFSVWAANMILFAWGGYLLRKVIRY